MEHRNAHYNRHGTIDVEIKHPKFGWIPFTASPDDEAGKELYAELLNGKVAAYVAPPERPDPLPTPEQKLARIGITKAELKALLAD